MPLCGIGAIALIFLQIRPSTPGLTSTVMAQQPPSACQDDSQATPSPGDDYRSCESNPLLSISQLGIAYWAAF